MNVELMQKLYEFFARDQQVETLYQSVHFSHILFSDVLSIVLVVVCNL